MKATFQDVLDSAIPKVLNLATTDDRIYRYLNEAQQRLMSRGKWWGTFGRYRFCVDNDCLTLPRQIAAVEAIAVCNSPIPVRNGWFEFLESGYGIQTMGTNSADWPNLQLADRGTGCTFADIVGVDKKLRVYADVAESASSRILIQGYDENENWIRTVDAGAWVDGEYITISTVPQLSTKYFKAITGIQKPETNGVVRLYEYAPDGTQRALGIYEWDETRPVYRKYVIPGLHNWCNSATCTTKTVTLMASLEFIPAKKATDWLMIGNIPALKDMCQAIRKSENNLFDEAAAWEARAVNELQKELRHYNGNGVVTPIRMQPRNIGGAGVTNLL